MNSSTLTTEMLSNHNPSSPSSTSAKSLAVFSLTSGMNGDSLKTVLLASLGNAYELFDFCLFGYFTPEIGAAFFPESSSSMQMVQTLALFSSAFITRPIGAVLFGELGDSDVVNGRVNAVALSLTLITIPSILMGILPTYSMIGSPAPVLLLILRLVQGLSVGGQLAGSYVLALEHCEQTSRGIRGAICDASAASGFLLASLVATFIRTILSAEAVFNYGWRIPFLLSIVIAPVLYYLTTHLQPKQAEQGGEKGADSTVTFSDNDNENEKKKGKEDKNALQAGALFQIIINPVSRRQLFGHVLANAVSQAAWYMLIIFTPLYLTSIFFITSDEIAASINLLVIIWYLGNLLFFGKMSDLNGHRPDNMKLGIIGLFLSAPLMFLSFATRNVGIILIAQMMFATCLAILKGGQAAFQFELWLHEPRMTYTGVAVGSNLASMIFGGTSPLIATTLCLVASDFRYLFAGFYISAISVISLFSITFLTKHPSEYPELALAAIEATVNPIFEKYKSFMSSSDDEDEDDDEEEDDSDSDSSGHEKEEAKENVEVGGAVIGKQGGGAEWLKELRR